MTDEELGSTIRIYYYVKAVSATSDGRQLGAEMRVSPEHAAGVSVSRHHPAMPVAESREARRVVKRVHEQLRRELDARAQARGVTHGDVRYTWYDPKEQAGEPQP
jgi:hypothetical protein